MTDQNDMLELPKDWKWVKLGEVCFTTSGGTPSRKEPRFYNGNIPWVKSGELGKGLIIDTEEKISKEAIKRSSAKIFPKGTLLIALYGATIGKLAFLGVDAATNQAICGIHKSDKIASNFLYYYLNYKKQKLVNQGTGGAQPNISQAILRDLTIPLPPKSIQLTIVAKIEELFSEIENGIESLRTAQQQLKTYRQSVLKWAFEGKLTNRLNSDLIDFPDEYNLGIAAESETEYKVAMNRNNLKNHTLDKGELPEGWKVLPLKDLAELITDGDHQAPPKSKEGVPFITISNVKKTNYKIDFSNTFSVTREYYLNLKRNRKPIKGDILYTVTGSFGIPILIDFQKEFCFQRHIGLIRPLETTNQKWLYYLLQSPNVFNQAKNTATGTAQKTVALNSLRNFQVPYCSMKEQIAIVQAIESRISVADKMEKNIAQSLHQAEALKQSHLKKAFEGRLVW